jgi:23S rRNA pseudouridine2605 synthase/16S rRNA pseudouridine516 synthase
LARERLQKILSRAGVASRRKVEELVLAGRVQLNGTVVKELGLRVDPSKDHIRVDGRLIKKLEPKVYVLMNKPRGILCTRMDPLGRPLVTDLLKGKKMRLYPAGRLDGDSEGLLILTNDGEFCQRMTHPRYQKQRTYHVKVRGRPGLQEIGTLRRGVTLSDGRTLPAEVTLMRGLKANSWWRVVVREGRNRLVRRMFQKIGHPVLRLRRVRYGPLTLGDLKPGDYRYLTREEVSYWLDPGGQ